MTERRSDPVPRLALVLLALFVATPFVLYLVPARWWHGDFDPPARLVTEMTRPTAAGDAPPTEGMAVEASGFGTVTDAPFVLARKGPEARLDGTIPAQAVAADVGRYVRGLPRERREGGNFNASRICTMESQPHYPGRIVLVDGCLRFQDAGTTEPGPLVLGIPSVHRDKEGYLAVGLRDAGPEFEIRVGEPDGVFAGVGCSMDRPVPAPPEVAQVCGVETMRRLGTIKRKRLCTAGELAQRERELEDYAQTQTRLRQATETCLARGTPERNCPPPVAPPPPALFFPDCRVEPPYSSQLSSTQPKPSR